jgi:hypothetical protein
MVDAGGEESRRGPVLPQRTVSNPVPKIPGKVEVILWIDYSDTAFEQDQTDTTRV